jgi:hypothetical protein
MKQPVEQGARGTLGGGDAVRVLHLPQNLRLADDHRVEPRRHAKEMACRVLVCPGVQMRHDLLGRQPVEIAQKRGHVSGGLAHVLAGHIELDAIAGGHHRSLAGRDAGSQRSERRRVAATSEGQPLTEVDGSGPVARADEQQVHVSRDVTRRRPRRNCGSRSESS